ncbi:uncharacterized protein JCM10292_007629 [Rhodotorula paludigena]|uniref:uncharacterized protein n=1 Tax=Rhodotorula paludigena TaxID=86838 RepID=UPI0031736D0F
MTQLLGSDAQGSRPAPYKLSAILTGHSSDVRSISTASSSSSNRLFSASRDGTARSWVLESSGDWTEERVYRDGHEGYVNALCFVAPKEAGSDDYGHLATAGTDAVIQLYSLSPASPSPTTPSHTLLGHAGNVCALHASRDGRRIASASWDLTARVWVWRDDAGDEGTGAWDCERVLVDHEAAVWDVMLLENEPELLLTASADSRIRLFEGSTVRHVFKGHEGPVRALAKLLPHDPACALFASTSNDCTIRIWNYQSGEGLTVLGSHDSFVYSLATIPHIAGGGLASSGEDGIIKIWNEEDGEEDQRIQVTAVSVWSLAALPNGDLACGCSDNAIWTFSRDSTRHARPDAYPQEQPRPRGAATTPAVSESSALDEPGQQEGEVKLIRRGDAVVAYQWDGSSWTEVGEVVDSRDDSPSLDAPSDRLNSPPKMEHEGKEYDYVFQIDVKDDEPPIPLPFNRDEDPHVIASAFVTANRLPESYLEQIVAFIRSSTL